MLPCNLQIYQLCTDSTRLTHPFLPEYVWAQSACQDNQRLQFPFVLPEKLKTLRAPTARRNTKTNAVQNDNDLPIDNIIEVDDNEIERCPLNTTLDEAL